MLAKLTIVAVSYGHPIPILRRFVSSLQCQTNQDDWKCEIYYDGLNTVKDYDHCSIHDFYDEVGFNNSFRWIETEHKGNYGHPNRQFGLDLCESPYIHFTNADNIYNPIFVEDVLAHLDQHPECDVLMFPIVHNYARGQRYQVLNPLPMLDNADFMSFIIKTDLMKQIGFKYLDFTGADGKILEEAVQRGATAQYITSIIGTHC